MWAFLRALDVSALRRVVVLGFGLRLLLWALSSGSGDIRTWSRIGGAVVADGLHRLYTSGPAMRHSPVAALWAGASVELAAFLEAPFELVFKVLPLGADLALLALVITSIRRRGGTDLDAWRGAAIQSTALAAVWATSHHGGLETVLIACALAAVVLVDEGDRPLLAGVALAAAIHMHLIALVLLPALWLLQARSLRQAGLFSLGLGVALAPLALPLSIKGFDFVSNAVVLTAPSNRWGLQFLFSEGGSLPIVGSFIELVGGRVQEKSWSIAVAASLLLGLRGRLLSRSGLETGALVIATFLVVTPSLGLQYAALPIAFLVVTDLRRALLYSVTSGLFLTLAYLGFAKAEMPLVSTHGGSVGFPAAVLAFCSWLVLVSFLIARLRPAPTTASAPTPMDRHRAFLPAVFAAIAAPFGVALALATPPFQVADEPLHAFVACALAHGQLVPGHDAPEPYTATLDVPADLVAFNRAIAMLKLPHKPGTKASVPALTDAARLPHDPALLHISAREETREMGVYPPAMYGPQALACAIGRAAPLRPWALLSAMRLANLAAFILLGALALWLLPVGREAVALLLLSPMALSSAASASGDGQLIPLVTLWVALILRTATTNGPPLRWWQMPGFAAVAFLFSIAKSVYLPLALAIVCIPTARFSSVVHRVVGVTGILTAALVGGLVWIPQTGDGLAAYAASLKLDPATTLDAAFHAPFKFLLSALRTLFRERILTGAVGTLGWRDTVLPFSAVAAFWATFLPLTLVGGGPRSSPRRGVIVGVAGVGAALGLLVFYALYFTKPGAPYVLNVQGRHMLPPLVFMCVAVAEFLALNAGDRARRLLLIVTALTSIFILVKALGAVEARYYEDRRDVPKMMRAAFSRPAAPAAGVVPPPHVTHPAADEVTPPGGAHPTP